MTRNAGILNGDRYTLTTISRSILLRMRSVSDKICRENQNTHFIFIVAPNILIYIEFTHQQVHFINLKTHIEIYIEIHINISPTYFGLRPSSGSLH